MSATAIAALVFRAILDRLAATGHSPRTLAGPRFSKATDSLTHSRYLLDRTWGKSPGRAVYPRAVPPGGYCMSYDLLHAVNRSSGWHR